mmetsp:Transcript_118893/g.380968  ORF Transcript_118893/g.380968 Transcript_118893/m.380968 type:complete len:258 (-) Transcript_118893:156-929(-)
MHLGLGPLDTHDPVLYVGLALWTTDFDSAWLSSLAGLDSFWPGQTWMVIHTDCQDLRSELWRWWTYQFTHASLSHVLLNCLLTLIVGAPLEGFHGHLRIAAVFNVGVLAGATCQALASPHTVAMVGMSGGLYALIGSWLWRARTGLIRIHHSGRAARMPSDLLFSRGMHVADLLINWRQTSYRYVKAVVVLFTSLADLLRVRLSTGETNTSEAAHFGGYLAGRYTIRPSSATSTGAACSAPERPVSASGHRRHLQPV